MHITHKQMSMKNILIMRHVMHVHNKRTRNDTWPLCLSIASQFPWELRMRGIIHTSINPLCVSNLLTTKDKLSSLSQGIPQSMVMHDMHVMIATPHFQIFQHIPFANSVDHNNRQLHSSTQPAAPQDAQPQPGVRPTDPTPASRQIHIQTINVNCIM